MADVSSIAVTFQAICSLLLGVIVAQLARIFRSHPAKLWAVSWFALSAALVSVRWYVAVHDALILVAYLLFEWIFLLLVWAGCHEIARGTRWNGQRIAYAAPFGLAAAIAFAELIPSLNQLFIGEAAIVALGSLASFRELAKTPENQREAAMGVMRAALLVFALLYAAEIPLFIVHTSVVNIPLLSYSSFADLLAAVFVGCAMIMVIAEAAHEQLAETLADFAAARSQLEQRLHTDALTEALSRHAFHWIQQGSEVDTEGVLSGVVVMIDIDDLKQINDTFGHDVGDTVIRAVANAIRAVIRADDLLFRWGGDEFLAILPNLSSPAVAERLATFGEAITVRLKDETSIRCHVTCGHAEFGVEQPIDQAIKIADQRMYAIRHSGRAEAERQA